MTNQNLDFNLGSFGEFLDFTKRKATETRRLLSSIDPSVSLLWGRGVGINREQGQGLNILNTPGEITGGLGRLGLGAFRSLQPTQENLQRDLKQIERVRGDYTANWGFVKVDQEFLEKMNTTPEDWREFSIASPVESELMLVEEQLSRLGSSTILPGRNRVEQLESGKFRLQRLLATDSSGVSRAEIQTRAAKNPAVAIEMGVTIAGAAFLPGEAAGGLVGGEVGRRVDMALGGDGTRGEHLGALGGMFIVGAPRNPMRLTTQIDGIHNLRKSQGLMSVSGVDLAFVEAKELLALAKGTYKLSGRSVNATLGLVNSSVENSFGRGIENISNSIENSAFRGLDEDTAKRILPAYEPLETIPQTTEKQLANLRKEIEITRLDIADAFRVNDVEEGQRLSAINTQRQRVYSNVWKSEQAKAMDGLPDNPTQTQIDDWSAEHALLDKEVNAAELEDFMTDEQIDEILNRQDDADIAAAAATVRQAERVPGMTRGDEFTVSEIIDPDAALRLAEEGNRDAVILGPRRDFPVYLSETGEPLLAITADRVPTGGRVYEITIRGLDFNGNPLPYEDDAFRNVFSPKQLASVMEEVVEQLDATEIVGFRLTRGGRPVNFTREQITNLASRQAAATPVVTPTKIYHGTRKSNLESFINEDGDLVLKQSENFAGRQVGVSFADNYASAAEYATRSSDTSGRSVAGRRQYNGSIFEIDADAVPTRLVEETSGELFSSRTNVVIPRGKFKILFPQRPDGKDSTQAFADMNNFDLAAREKAMNLSNRDLASEIALKVVREETAQKSHGGELPGYIKENRRLTQFELDIADKFGPDAVDNPHGQYLQSELDRRYNMLSDRERVAFQAEMIEAFNGMPKNVKNAEFMPENVMDIYRPSSYIESLDERYARKFITELEVLSQIGKPVGTKVRIIRRNGQDVVEDTGQIVGPDKVDIPKNDKERNILATYRPDISPSQLDMLNEDRTLAEMAARRDSDSIFYPGNPKPRQLGDPVGMSGDDISGNLRAHQSHLALGDSLEIPSWETPGWTFARWWQGARNEEGLRMNETMNELKEFADSIELPGRRIVDEVTGEVTVLDPDKYWSFDTAMPIFRALHVGDDHQHYLDLTGDQQRLVDKIKEWRNQEENEMFDFLQWAGQEDAELWRYDLKNFAMVMVANPNYFPRAWRRFDQKDGETIWDLKGSQREQAMRDFGIQDDGAPHVYTQFDPDRTSFLKRRQPRTFDSMVDGKTEDGADLGLALYVPKTYNPIAMMAERRMAGVEYREIIRFMTRMKQMGLLKEAADPTAGKGWRVPGEGIPLFRGRTNHETGEQIFGAQVVPNEIANWVEKTYGNPESKITPRMKNWSNRAKTTKLLVSAFQHLDIANRATAAGLAPMNNLSHVLNKQFPPGLKVPSLWLKMGAVQFWGPYRKKFKADLLGNADVQVNKDFDMTWGDLIREGWEVRGDLSMIQREFLDRIDNYIIPRTLKSFGEVGGTIPRALKKLSDFWQDGLFEGVYTVAQQWALENFIVPSIRAQHPDWSRKMVAAMAAENVNVMFSSLGSWQTALRTLPPTAQDALQVAIFSTNETEALLRGAARTALPRIVNRNREAKVTTRFGFGGSTNLNVPRSNLETKRTFRDDPGDLAWSGLGPIPDRWHSRPASQARKGIPIPGTSSDIVMSEHFRVFADYHAGMYLYLGVLANLINLWATGEALPAEAYKPINSNDPYSPFGPAYKNQFFSPQAPGIEGRGGTPIYVDLVGQMDTAFRWMTDPVNATASRMNVIPRAIMNQITATNFMAQPLEMRAIGRDPVTPASYSRPTREELYDGDNFYPGGAFNPLNQGERIGQFAQDIGFPIPAMSAASGLREKFPALGHVIPPGESRLGVTGNLVQSIINLRSKGTSELKKEAGIATFDAPAVGEIGEDPDDPRLAMSDFHNQAFTLEDKKLDEELMLRELEQVIRDSGTGGRGGKWGWISEKEAKRMWELHSEDPRIRQALINKAKWEGWNTALWIGTKRRADLPPRKPPLEPGFRIGIEGKPVYVGE